MQYMHYGHELRSKFAKTWLRTRKIENNHGGVGEESVEESLPLSVEIPGPRLG